MAIVPDMCSPKQQYVHSHSQTVVSLEDSHNGLLIITNNTGEKSTSNAFLLPQDCQYRQCCVSSVNRNKLMSYPVIMSLYSNDSNTKGNCLL